MAIKPKMDRKPGGTSRFEAMLNPGNAMAASEQKPTIVSAEPVGEPDNTPAPRKKQEKDKFKNGQPLRIDKGLWLRLKSLQLKREIQGTRTTLMELANEALDAFLTAQGE